MAIVKRTAGALGLLIILLLLAAGCATVSPQAGAKLADTGVETANTTKGTINSTRLGLETYIQGQYLQAGLRGTAPPDALTPEGDSTLNEVKKIEKSLAAREAVLTAMAGTYAAFGALAKSTFAQDLPQAVEKFGGAINGYAQAVGYQEALPAMGIKLGSQGASLAAKCVLARLLKECSQTIREGVTQFRNIFDKEKQALININKEMVKQSGWIAKEFYELNIARPHPILRTSLGDFGLEYDAQQANRMLDALPTSPKTPAKPGMAAAETQSGPSAGAAAKLKAAILNVIQRRIKLNQDLQEEIITKTAASLDDLIKAHESFEKGEPLNLTRLNQDLVELKTTTDMVKQLREELKSKQ